MAASSGVASLMRSVVTRAWEYCVVPKKCP